jgi:hypothetical protein
MNVLEAYRIGDLRLRLIERASPDPELVSSYYIISEHLGDHRFAAITGAGYYLKQARKTVRYYTERELARLESERDDR